MTKSGWIIFVSICVVVLGGLILVSRQDSIDVSSINPTSILPASADNGNIADHVFGKKDSAVIIYEYGDYQCPGCSSAAPAIRKVATKYEDKIGLVFRNYPLTTIHPNALAAASSAEAAGLQGKYWEMHDKIYDEQQVWENFTVSERTDYFVSLAQNLGLNTATFKTDLESSAVRKKINFDTAIGKKLNITSTPTIYVNDENISGVRYEGDKLVDSSSTNSPYVWSDADALEKLIIIPALKKQGVSLE